MTFRRQDIPKTTRKLKEGSGRRLYPRFLKDRAVVPKVELAIDYLDRMTGRRRGELSPETVLELFGDPKLARCLLACMGETYRYRVRSFADVLGQETAARLAGFGLTTPWELRGFLYLAANATRAGFVGDAERPSFLAERGETLGLTAGQIDQLIHLDAERNAELIRVGNRPSAEEIVARYNATLVLSVLRHASLVSLTLPGLDERDVERICARHGIAPELTGTESVQLRGRKSAVGTWSGFGARLARCAFHLMAICPRAPEGQARVHFGEQAYWFEIDAAVAAMARPKLRAVADGDGLIRAGELAEALVSHRRGTDALAGWTVRRWPEPLVADGALALPELSLTRDGAAIAVVPLAGGAGQKTALAAIERLHARRPVLVLAEGPVLTGAPVLLTSEGPERLVELLAAIVPEPVAGPSPLEQVADELARANWLDVDALSRLLGEPDDVETAVAPLTRAGDAVLLPGAGLCAAGVVAWLRALLAGGPVDIGGLRRAALEAVGDGAAADALTLHVLGEATLQVAAPGPDRAAAVA